MKCIQAPWLRRGLYVEVMSMIYGHDGRCNPLLFMGFGSEQEGTGGDKRGKEREEKYGVSKAVCCGKEGKNIAQERESFCMERVLRVQWELAAKVLKNRKSRERKNGCRKARRKRTKWKKKGGLFASNQREPKRGSFVYGN